MNASLRNALADLAEQQPFTPDPSAWDRGRRARRRDRAMLVAAVLVLVACLSGIGVLGLGQPDVQPADQQDRGALPGTIHAVPERLAEPAPDDSGEMRWKAEVAADDLATGPGSVLFQTLVRPLPVLVRASDGAHLPLTLPDDTQSMLLDGDGPGQALSPDGTRLAYGYGTPAEGRTDDAPVPCGIRIVDLRDGSVRDIDLRTFLTEGQALLVSTVAWSPDGRWLAWSGQQLEQFNASGQGTSSRLTKQEQSGVIAPDATTSRSLTDGMTSIMGVSDSGTVVGTRRGEPVVWDGSFTTLPTTKRQARLAGYGNYPAPSGAMSPDGRHLLLANSYPSGDAGVLLLDTRTGELLERPLPPDQGPAGTRALGWVNEDLVAVEVTPREPRDGGWTTTSGPQVVVMSSPTVPRDDWTYRIAVHTQDDGTAGVDNLSVAVDLLGLGEGVPGVTGVADFPAPTWPWPIERKIAVGVLALLAALAGAVVVRRLLSARPPRRPA